MGPPGLDLRPSRRYVLPAALRDELDGVFGALLQTDELPDALAAAPAIAAVGDVVSRTLHELGIRPVVFVVDYKTQRGADDEGLRGVLSAWGDREVRVQNPPATITREAWDAVRDAFAQPARTTTRIVVDGEEDLLGIPCFLEIENGGTVLYGAPGKGVVVVTCDAAFKGRVRSLLERFESA